MSSSGSVTQWIAQLKAGDPAAARPLWDRYFQQMVAHARRKLAAAPRRAGDEEDVALSAFHSFWQAAAQGRFPRLEDRHDLWQLLLVITDRKALKLAARERRQRRGGGQVLDEAACAAGWPTAVSFLTEAPEPAPEFAALVADECRRLLLALGDAELRQVAVLKMEGYTVPEIAGRIGWAPRTVKRWLNLIRRTWEKELQP